MIKFTSTLDDREAQRVFDRIALFVRSPVEALQAAADGLKARITVSSFGAMSDPWGNAWPALAPATLKDRARRGNQSATPLKDTHRMFNSLLAATVGNTGFVTMGGGNDRFPEVHQFGNGRIPARPTFPIDASGVNMPKNWEPDVYGAFDKVLGKLT